jgi:hypothetical protein
MAKSGIARIKGAKKLDVRGIMDELSKEMQERNSPQFKERERRRKEENKRRSFMSRAKKAGFTSSMAKFLYENLADADHEHWNGMIGGE